MSDLINKVRKAFGEARAADIDTNDLEHAFVLLTYRGDQPELREDVMEELDFRADGDPEQGVAALIKRLSED